VDVTDVVVVLVVPVADVSVVDIVPVVLVMAVSEADIVPVLPVAAVSVAVLMDVSVAAVSVFVFSSFLQLTANRPTRQTAINVSTNDFFIRYGSPGLI
jgi:hypothetical protein